VLYNGPVEKMTTLWDRVRELRKARGWSQQALGDRAGVTAQTVWLLETHQLKDVKLSTLSKIAGALEVPVPDLLA
jgi:transcriptional regulator with XRE-family HTH domain